MNCKVTECAESSKEFVWKIVRYLIEQSAVMSLFGELLGFLLSRDI